MEYEVVKGCIELGESSNTPWLQCQMPPGRKPGVHKAAGVTGYTQNSKVGMDANDPGNAADLVAMEELDIANLTLWEEAEQKMAEGISLSEEHIDIEGGAIQADETDGTGDGNKESASTTTQGIPTLERSTPRNRTVNSNFPGFELLSVKQASPRVFVEDCRINIGEESCSHAFAEGGAGQLVGAHEEVPILVPNDDRDPDLQAIHVLMVFFVLYLICSEMVTWWVANIA